MAQKAMQLKSETESLCAEDPKGPSIIMAYTYRVFWGSKYIP